MDKFNRLTKAIILDITIGGLLYFYILFPQLRDAKIDDRRHKNVRNHLRGERKPSLSCYKKGDRWYLHDHADPDFSGDVFTIFAIVNKIRNIANNFKQILQGIYTAVTGEEAPKVETDRKSFVKMEESELPEGVKFLIEEVSFDDLGEDQINFLNQHGISAEFMKALGSVFLRSYTFEASSGKVYKIYKPDGEVIIGHKFKDSVKIYKPYDPEYKCMWLGEKPDGYYYGNQYLEELYNKSNPKNLESRVLNDKAQIVLCAGEKDTLIVNSLGFYGFCLNSETTTYFPEDLLIKILDINDFVKDFELVIVYDDDATGIKQAKRIAEKHSKYEYNIRVVEFPSKLKENGGKDVADWITLGLPRAELKQLINGDCPISSVSPPVLIADTITEEAIAEVIVEDDTEEEETLDDDEDSEFSFSRKVYDNLPDLLLRALEPFDNSFKTMMLVSFITSIGSSLKNVVGKFRDGKLFPNLYTIVVAPPASGKSQMKWAKELLMPIELNLVAESITNKKEYDDRKSKYKRGEITLKELGNKPAFKTMLIPTDITAPMLVKQITDNDGFGCMFDTEIDGLVESNSSNLRSFNDILRKNSENERVSLSRKTDAERIFIDQPKMSLLLSGTPRQFSKLIYDAENGLFSRIITINFKGHQDWIDSFCVEPFNFERHFQVLGDELYNYYLELDSLPNSVNFSLTNEQLIQLDKEFSKRVVMVKQVAGVDGRASVMRLGAITVKIAMILSTIRRLESGQLHNQFSCDKNDFETALAISEVLLNHTLRSLAVMNVNRLENCYRGIKLDYFYALPKSFTYADSQELAEEMGIKLRTAQKWVYKFRDEGFLNNPVKGKFIKIE